MSRLHVEREDLFFFYGTLIDQKWTHGDGEYLGPAMVEGRLYSTGVYPALKLGVGGTVVGMLWQPKAHLPEGAIDVIASRLDRYEGFSGRDHDLFKRSMESVSIRHGNIDAWVYEYAGPTSALELIPHGSWSTFKAARNDNGFAF